MASYVVVKDETLASAAASSMLGRHFWTGGGIADATEYLKNNRGDVCMVRHNGKKVLIGGPIPDGTAVDVSNKNFSHVADSFDVGQMTAHVVAWFKTDFSKDVTVNILESGEMTAVGPNSKLISLARTTPALLDMAATENGRVIGQYSSVGTLGHSGDMHSTIGNVYCLHHELGLKPSRGNMKEYFLVGYSSKPLKAWRDSRVFWIVYDSDTDTCWLVPHDLSHDAVGDTVSATMPLVSKSDRDGMIRVCHLSRPVQASLASASPLRPENRAHSAFLNECTNAANSIDWSQLTDGRVSKGKTDTCVTTVAGTGVAAGSDRDEKVANQIDHAIAVFDGCSDVLFKGFPTTLVDGRGDVLSTMRGPLKTFARGCCANSRVVFIDGTQACATSEINSVFKQLSGVIIVKMDDPDIYKLNQVRWNMARGYRTPVVALTPDGCKHLCGPLPPTVEIEDHPTPVAGTPIPTEVVKEIVEFALSPDGDTYFGPLYQPVPSYEQVRSAISDFIIGVRDKDFSVIIDDDVSAAENTFTDDDFRRLMELINMLSVSTATAVERNNLAIRIVKLLQTLAKEVASGAIIADTVQQKDASDMEILNTWCGDLVWAAELKDVLEDLLKEFSIKIVVQDGMTDLSLVMKLDEAIKKKKSQLERRLRDRKKATFNNWKKTFNAVFNPALEALMRCIGENPKYHKLFGEVKNASMTGVITRATQSTNKKLVSGNPEDIMKLFHRLGATSFINFRINFLQTWKTKVVNEICIVDRPGQGFNDPNSFVPADHRIEDGPEDPVAAYETDVRHLFVLPVFARLPKFIDEDDSDDSDVEDLKQMPIAPAPEDLAKYVLMRDEFVLRDPEQGPRHPMWLYVDWLFDQIKTIHQVPEKQAAPLATKALGYAVLQIMTNNPEPDQGTMEIVTSIIHAINFIGARGEPPHSTIDSFFNIGSTYVPMTRDIEKSPWQIEVVNILSRAVDYVRLLMSPAEYLQIRCNFQRAAANMVKRQIVQKLLEYHKEDMKNNGESHNDYVARVNSEFYPAYREIVETLGMLIEADAETFQLTDDLRERIDFLHHTILVVWSKSMRRCRIGPVREMVKALKSFSQKGSKAMAYIVDRKPYLEQLYDQVFHIKYESCDQVMIGEVCKIIGARTRNPEHEKHDNWLDRVAEAINDVTKYDEKMSGFAHGNNYKRLPTALILKMLNSLKNNPASNDAVTFGDIKTLLAHINIDVKNVADLKVKSGSPDGKKPVLERIRKAWWMCPDLVTEATRETREEDAVPDVALIPMNAGVAESSNIMAILGDTYHKFNLARLFSRELGPMRAFIRENYKFHLEWFEDTIKAAGLPRCFDPSMVRGNEIMAIYAIVQRLVHELVQDEADRGDRARDAVYGEITDPLGEDEDANPANNTLAKNK